ncbi:swr1 complex component [Perkinsus chesapeaki]|uniref:Swr1 complex component n=1 Tax=Perkinsus chesapeaki TaxID=330153 RepID=A0A7J6N0N8_PERCH|nr:swr1 complex component [Perkinsus chesapeaki]
MVQRLTYRRKVNFNTKSNKQKLVKTPGGNLVYHKITKTATGPRCGDCKGKINGVKCLRPFKYSQLKQRERHVSRAYGGSICGKCVKQRIVRAFLLEEQKLVRAALAEKARKAAQKSEKKAKVSKKLDALVEKSELFAASVGDALDTTIDSYSSPPPPSHESVNRIADSESLTDEERRQARVCGLLRDFSFVLHCGTDIADWRRGPYQHVGLDWLVTLHDQNLNGILADEMGLGKTIQTIALLAHLACAENIWGPHLVVVPTSVVLNWELEFKRWLPGFKVLTYYGNQKERKWKRIGWSKPNSFNVCIVSYNLVVRDAQAFRRMRWYYLILDEAQHIKNFRSQRWQTLLTFNSQRRLLLTGTPLQNNLIEMWSLLHFLMPDVFASHSQFQEWFSDPLTDAIEKQNSTEGQRDLLQRLHKVIRPFILRRLKRQVEKQMPKKYEHVVKVPLSRRQQGLYEEFMNQRDIRHQIDNLDCMGMMNVLMQLRKVCNHPDLFDPRPVRSPLAVSALVIQLPATVLFWPTTPYNVDSDRTASYPTKCLPLEEVRGDSRRRAIWSNMLALKELPDGEFIGRGEQPQYRCFLDYCKHKLTGCPLGTTKRWLEDTYLAEERERWRVARNYEQHQVAYRNVRYGQNVGAPLYGADCVSQCRVPLWNANACGKLSALCLTPSQRLDRYWATWRPYLQYVVKVVAPTPVVELSGGCMQSAKISRMQRYANLRTTEIESMDKNSQAYHRIARLRYCHFPDKDMIEIDCGKLRKLGGLLTSLRRRGHKCIIFTQMSRMLDIIEGFMNLHGFTYVRLDGSTPLEQRQLVVEAFNKSPKIFAFIASTRAGGVGINLTGADCVIFYDSDWNPAMDRQAMDRCHRIGQTRDVHIFRLLSEHTIEENIFHKQLQKRMLDDVVVDQGAFTTQTIIRWNGVDIADMLKGTDDDGSTSTAELLKMTTNDIEAAMEGAEDEDDAKARENLLQEQRQEGIDLRRDFEGTSSGKETPGQQQSRRYCQSSPDASSTVSADPHNCLTPIVRYAIKCVTEQLRELGDESDLSSTSEASSVWASQASSQSSGEDSEAVSSLVSD